MANSIEFKLLAPYNKAAALTGSFSDWEEIPMEKGEGGYFRTQVNLEDGTYQYKFRVQSKSWFFEDDEWVTITDPYATDIDNASQNGVVRLKDGERIVDTYAWQHDENPLPPDHQLIIYEMHVGDFSGGEDDPYPRGCYKHVVEKLDYLCELGITAIELMPIKEYPGDYSWGYNPRYFFAPESSYGSTDELKKLIDECHGRGIRVLMDGIYNHSESECPLTQIDHDYWYHHSPKDEEYNWGPEFNYEFYDENYDRFPARQFSGDAIRFWIEEYHTDGIRFDAAKQIGNFDFLGWVVSQAETWSGPKPFYNVAEYLPDNPGVTGVDGPMDGVWHYSFYFTLRDQLCDDQFDLEKLKDVLDCRRQGYTGAVNVVNFLSNHDHDHLLAELGDRQILDDAAFKRARLGAVLLMTAVGLPMLWMGEEFGEYKHKTIEPNKIDWTLLKNDSNRNLLEYYKGLIALRKQNHALYGENIEFFHEDPEGRIFAYTRWNDEGSRVAVVVNFSDNFLSDYTFPNFPADGTWHEWTGNYDVEVQDGHLTTDLAEFEAKVYVWQ
ncbi:MAG: alpha-amylase [Leptolyngbyaceae cyanobacterium SM1_1_3]|nr:alpha-amylase [Leptolyngbyaceae cyanobacterium SM1_1_3]NJN03461.1 alpha-amylase [Leptolyngbyaceae cyanobacterium RM1_1_2]NJO08775.1 alpha-amylase [Leptolyngbyaceae cyanobacterium SL_1_1]